jgi:hypothetical protein
MSQVEDLQQAVKAQEVAPGFSHENLEGWIPTLATPEEIFAAMEKAFDYRGDVTITLKAGSRIEGYIFDRRAGADIYQSAVRIIPKDTKERITIPYCEIAALAFTGRDTAAGKNWEAWLRKYWEKKEAGEKNIGIEAEALD